MYDAVYFVFYVPNNSADIDYEYQAFFGIEYIRAYFFDLFFPDGKVNPDVMSLYGMSCFHLDKLSQFDKDEFEKEDDIVQIQGRNSTYFVLKFVNDDSLERVQMVVAKKENTDFKLLYIGEEDEDESVALTSEYEEEGYTVVSFVKSLL